MRVSLDKATVTAEKSSDVILLNLPYFGPLHSKQSRSFKWGKKKVREGRKAKGEDEQRRSCTQANIYPQKHCRTPEKGQGLRISESASRCSATGPVLGI